MKVNGVGLVPEPGDEVYTPAGKARVTEVQESPHSHGVVHFVRVGLGSGRSYNWEQYLAAQQDRLKRRFGGV